MHTMVHIMHIRGSGWYALDYVNTTAVGVGVLAVLQ